MKNSAEITIKFYRQRNAGPAAARNHGIKYAESELVVFTDDDCMPAPNCLEIHMSSLSEDQKCAGVGGSVIRKRNRIISRYIDDVGVMAHPIHNGEVHYLITANALFRSLCLVEVGGFDSRIFCPGGEDPDLSFRLRDHGYYFSSTHLAVIKHEH